MEVKGGEGQGMWVGGEVGGVMGGVMVNEVGWWIRGGGVGGGLVSGVGVLV